MKKIILLLLFSLAIAAQNQMATNSGKTFYFVFNKIEDNNLIYELPNDTTHARYAIRYDSVRMFTYSQPKLVQYLGTYPNWDKKGRYIEDVFSTAAIKEPIKIYSAGDYLVKASNNILTGVVIQALSAVLIGVSPYFVTYEEKKQVSFKGVEIQNYDGTKTKIPEITTTTIVPNFELQKTAIIVGSAGMLIGTVFQITGVVQIGQAGRKLNQKPIE